MAKETVGVEVDVKFQSVGNMKKELRAATSDLIAMNEKFGASSKEATEAARRVAKLKDAIGDAKALADTFNPDKKFVALGGAVQGAVSGFSALQGAMGLFGDKGKEVEAMLLKVQSAMALQQGLSGIAGSIDSFKLLAGTIKTQVVTAFTTLKGAMMATGIGLITAAVAFLVTNFDKVKKTVTDLFPALENMGSMMDRLKQIAMGVGNALLQFLAAPISALIKVFKGDFSGAFEAVKNGMSFVKNFREGEQREIKSQADEREKIRQDELKKKKAHDDKILEQQRATAEKLRQERMAAEQQYTQWLQTERERQLKLTMTDFEKEVFEFKKKYDQQLAIAKKYGFDITQLEQLRFAESVAIINKETAENKKGLDLKLGDFTAQAPKIAAVTSTITANEDANSKARVNILESEKEARLMILNEVSGGLSALSDLVGRQTKAGKILAISQATIDTYLSATKAFQSLAGIPIVGPALGGIAAGAAVASGIANIRRIVAVQVPGGGGGSIPSMDTKAPMVPTLSPTVQTNVQNAQAINQMSNQSTRAYVLNSDIQNEQQRNAYLQRNASI